MYELLIYKNDDWHSLDLTDEAIAMVFQINTLAELKDLNASYSQNIKVPKSVRNCELFEYANIFDARSDYPYNIYPCVVYCEGLQITPDGFNLELLSVGSDYFNCQVTSNAKGLFSRLQELGMDALNLGYISYQTEAIRIYQTDQNIRFFVPAAYSRAPLTAEIYTYPFSPGPRKDDKMLLTSAFRPYIRLRRAVHKMLTDQGYTPDIQLEDDDVFLSLLNSKSDSLASRGNAHAFVQSDFSRLPVYSFGDDSLLEIYSVGDLIDRMDMTDAAIDVDTTQGLVYTAPDNVNASFHFSMTSQSNFRVHFRIRKFGIPLSEYPSRVDQTAEAMMQYEASQVEEVILTKAELQALPNGRWVSPVISLSVAEKVYLEHIILDLAEPSQGGTSATANIDIFFEGDESMVVASGNINVGKCLGFSNQLDVLKFYTQLYGLTVVVDEKTKTVKMFNYRSLIDQAEAGEATDWSGKLDVGSERLVSFKTGSYAQENYIKLEDNEFWGDSDKASIKVDNKNLQASKELFSIQAEAGHNLTVAVPSLFNINIEELVDADPFYTLEEMDGVEYIPYWSQKNEGAIAYKCPYWKRKKNKRHLVKEIPTEGIIPVDYVPRGLQGPFSAYIENYSVAQSVTIGYFVDKYYTTLEDNILNKVRMIEADFNLTPIDIQNLDLTKPVYIEHYGQYFYIAKINNYQANKLTRVTLVCLNMD